MIDDQTDFQDAFGPDEPKPMPDINTATAKKPRKPAHLRSVPSDRTASTNPDWLPWHFRIGRDDWIEAKDDQEESGWRRVCSFIQIPAVTRDANGLDWGRLIVIRNRDGNEHEYAMPMALLAGSGEQLRAVLLGMGLETEHGRNSREGLNRLLQSATPTERALSVRRNGWHGAIFMTPTGAIGPANGERLVFQSEFAGDHAFALNGTLDGWRDGVAALASGNSRLMFAISASFAAALLSPAGLESGGFHLRGPSSCGKSTALRCAGSVWGGKRHGEYFRPWRATDNGLEGIAALHCDALLALDEIGQADPEKLGAIAYMLANGSGKGRASKDGQARAPTTWTTLFLSTGEISLAQKMAEGFKAKSVMAGQEVRVVDLPADAGEGNGIFDTLHGRSSASALADELRDVSRADFGHAARAFVEHVAGNFDATVTFVKAGIAEFVRQQCPVEADGQVRRVAARFGVVAAAGEIATREGITGWSTGDAEQAAARLFGEWLTNRGGTGATEIKTGLDAVRAFLDAHGNSRFIPFGQPEATVPNCAGWRRKDGAFLVFPDAWSNDVLKGHDAGRIASEMARHQWLETGGDGKTSKVARYGSECSAKSRRFYVVSPSFLTNGGEQ